jgi:hypothetical protein
MIDRLAVTVSYWYVQEQADCIIGRDYPAPMIDHDVAVTQNAKETQIILQSALCSRLKL